jgi:hypothetical protein
MSTTIEIPWSSEEEWAELPFNPFPDENEDGVLTASRERYGPLHWLADGIRFSDADGNVYRKVADGPVQSACVVTDGEKFAQFDGSGVVYHGAGRGRRA